MAYIADDMTYAGPCVKCRSPVYVPNALYTAAKASPSISFYCSYGHSLHFAPGESKIDELQRELNIAKQRLAMKDDLIKAAQAEAAENARRLSAAKGRITKLRNRAAAGVCPCCNRTFAALARHMATKHPGFKQEDTAP